METPLLESLFSETEPRPVTVSELNADVKRVLERSFSSVWVEGEITNFHSAASGHWYFSLTDGESYIKAACFRGQNLRIRFKPANGLQVHVRGRITTYDKRGEYQLLVESLEPVGEGALAVAFEQIKERLRREGLFDSALKRPLPSFPHRVGIVTSPNGAAIHDIMTVLDRRARSVNIVIIPTLVQGEFAAEQIAAGIELANRFNGTCSEDEKIEVLIVGRGGGSAEDLWAFNEEIVARAIRASAIPVISAVGHETDFTIADLAADLRAPTPSAAAEIVARAETEVIAHLGRLAAELVRSANLRLMEASSSLQSLAMSPVFTEFPARLRETRHGIELLAGRMQASILGQHRNAKDRFKDILGRLSPIKLSADVAAARRQLAELENRRDKAVTETARMRLRRLETAAARLDSLSPLAVLGRGYSITEKYDGTIVRDYRQVSEGDRVKIRLGHGRIEADVTSRADEDRKILKESEPR